MWVSTCWRIQINVKDGILTISATRNREPAPAPPKVTGGGAVGAAAVTATEGSIDTPLVATLSVTPTPTAGGATTGDGADAEPGKEWRRQERVVGQLSRTVALSKVCVVPPHLFVPRTLTHSLSTDPPDCRRDGHRCTDEVRGAVGAYSESA